MIDKNRVQNAVRELLLAIGEDPDREGLKETPLRVARMYEEIFAGIGRNPADEIKLFREEGAGEMVIVRDIPFYSMCEHHLMPFFGRMDVVYIPKDNNVLGLSKIARIADTIARKPQLQERLTCEVAETIMNGANALGAAVVAEAEHLCMTMRGVRKPGSKTVTSGFWGVLKTDAALRAEALSLLRKR
ncbi:MAG: GTP cyclohydrolase I FolE [Spirochaetaceae bacterium]|jgi:GTP cyclohydrolase I|nr:GTP cyclohydrolase I FolE [Spirochaetaceae bacterium]